MDITTVRTVAEGPVRIAVDAMGGDHAPEEVVVGALNWARDHSGDRVILVGAPDRIEACAGHALPPNVSIVPASQVVEMSEQPALALKAKKDASILVATDLVKEGKADVLVTAGHTGAGVAAAIFRLGRLPGVDRPALAVQLPTDSKPFLLIDIGANPDSTPENLWQYAHMGALYAERVLAVPNPRVALLSIGEERGKGDARIQRATKLLDEDGSLNFIGNVEGRDLPKHGTDVAVCDAVLGNVTMKFYEGLGSTFKRVLEREFRRNLRGMLGYLMMRPALGRLEVLFDAEKLGASPLLGVNGMVLITHGSAKRRMIWYSLDVAATAARAKVPDAIEDAFRDYDRRTGRRKPADASADADAESEAVP